MSLTKAIDKLKKEKKLSYRQLDYKSGIPAQNLSSYARGKLKPPKNKDFYEKLASAFQVDPFYFEEYVELVAIERIRSNRELADRIATGKAVKITEPQIDGKPLNEDEIEEVRRHRALVERLKRKANSA